MGIHCEIYSISRYLFLQCMLRNRPVQFEDCTDSSESLSFVADENQVSFDSDIWGEGFSTISRQSIFIPSVKTEEFSIRAVNMWSTDDDKVNITDTPKTNSSLPLTGRHKQVGKKSAQPRWKN